jgi:hypothetical protein
MKRCLLNPIIYLPQASTLQNPACLKMMSFPWTAVGLARTQCKCCQKSCWTTVLSNFLSLSGCVDCECGIFKLLNSLETNSSLTHLDISWCPGSGNSASFQKFSDVLIGNESLRTVASGNRDLELTVHDSLTHLMTGFHFNNTLVDFNFTGKILSTDDYCSLISQEFHELIESNRAKFQQDVRISLFSTLSKLSLVESNLLIMILEMACQYKNFYMYRQIDESASVPWRIQKI